MPIEPSQTPPSPPVESRARVMIVDDHPAMREGLATIFSDLSSVEIVDQRGSAEDAITHAPLVRPDVVTLDHRLPGMTGIDACGALLAARPTARILILTLHSSRELARLARQAGAHGFVSKESDPGTLRHALATVSAGRTYFDRQPGKPGATGILSRRESDVLECLAADASTEETAEALCISQRTVQQHVNTAMQKLGVRHRSGAVAAAVRRGVA